MSKVQTRRGVSMSQAMHAAAVEFCTTHNLTLSQVTEAALRFVMALGPTALAKVDGKLALVYPPPPAATPPTPPVDHEPKRAWLDEARADAKARPFEEVTREATADDADLPVISPHHNQAGYPRDFVIGPSDDEVAYTPPEPALATEIGGGARSQMFSSPPADIRDDSPSDVRVVYDE